MLIGLAKIAKMRRPGVNKQVIVVYTDSMALVTALQSGPIRQNHFAHFAHRSLLHQQTSKMITHLVGVPRQNWLSLDPEYATRWGIINDWRPITSDRTTIGGADGVVCRTTVQHVYNECDDLQIGALRDGLRATTGWEITTECLVRDPNTALIFHDQALSYLRH